MIRTYIFNSEEFEQAYGTFTLSDFVLMHLYNQDEYVASITYNGGFTRAYSTIPESELESRYWTLFT